MFGKIHYIIIQSEHISANKSFVIKKTQQVYDLGLYKLGVLKINKSSRLKYSYMLVLSNLFSNPVSMYLYRCVLPCVNTYLQINTV